METKLYNSEIVELAKRIYANVVTSMDTDVTTCKELAEMSIHDAKIIIDELNAKGYYCSDMEDKKEHDRISFVLNTLLIEAIPNIRVNNAIRYHMDSFNQPARVYDILKIGKHKLLMARNIGKKSIRLIEDYFKQVGLTWNMDLTKYGF